jgi:hypothetical protein
MVNGLIPSLFTFFHDVRYLQQCVDCISWLMTKPPPGQSIAHAMELRHKAISQSKGRVVIQVAEDEFITRQGSKADQVDLGNRQLIACAMRHYPDIPKKPERENQGGKVMKCKANADKAVLRKVADLAACVGYESDQITDLQRYPTSNTRRGDPGHPKPFLVTSGTGVAIRKRCREPQDKGYEEDRDFLFINHLHEERDAQGESVTSFFVRRSIYLAFFGKPTTAYTNGSSTSSPLGSTSEGFGRSSPQLSDHNEPSRFYHDGRNPTEGSPEPLGDDLEDILSAYAQQEETEDAVMMQEQEQERQEQERQEQERHRLEEERFELRRIEEELERADLQERLAQALQAKGNLEQEKRRQRELWEREKEREVEERRRQETREQERREREKSLKDSERKRKGLTQIDMESVATRNQKERQEGQGAEEQDNLTDNVDSRAYATSLQGQSEENQVRINMKIREGGIWIDLPHLMVDFSDLSDFESVMLDYIRKGIRPFDTGLGMMHPKECFSTVIGNGTNTILLIPGDAGLDINDDVLSSASKIHANAISEAKLGQKRVAEDDISRFYHARKMR